VRDAWVIVLVVVLQACLDLALTVDALFGVIDQMIA
jgi:hypothetical protein